MPKNRRCGGLFAPRAGRAPARATQVLAWAWQFRSWRSRKRRQAMTISNCDVISSVGRFFNSRLGVLINPFIVFEFAVTNFSGTHPKTSGSCAKKRME
jgi:hypothetical protein